MFPSHLSVNDLGVFAVVMVFGLIVVLLFMFDFRGASKGPTIPGEQPSDPEMGNLGDMGKAGSLHEYLMLLHEKYGAIAGFWWGKNYVVSLASPEYWKEAQPLFDRPPDLFKLFEPLIGKKSIQYVNGPEGRKRRQLIDRSFSHEAVKDYYEHFVRVAKETADNFAKCSPEEHIPLDKSMITMAVKAIAVAGMGRIFMDEKEIDKLATMYNEAWEEMEARLMGPPPAADSEREKKFQKARAGLHGLVKDIIKRRQQDDEKAEKLFIDSILDCDFMDEEEICDDVISFLIGGFHTTGNMMTWCLYFLTKHPEVQEKVFDELDKVLGDEEDIKPQVVSELTYTRQVIDETLRAAVVAPWGARVYEYDLQVDEYVIPKETPILLPFGVVLQDPNLWPEPRRFDPDRFSPENIKQLPSLAYQPFGFAGKRKCPGWRFSIAEGLVFLSILIRRFKFHLVEGQEVKPVHRLVTAPAEEIWVTVTKR